MNLTHDKEFQRQLLNHPAYRHHGVDPLWRIIAIMGWVTVLALMLAIAARSQTLVVGLNSKRASSPASAGGHMTPLLWSNDNRFISPSPRSTIINVSDRFRGSEMKRMGSGRIL